MGQIDVWERPVVSNLDRAILYKQDCSPSYSPSLRSA